MKKPLSSLAPLFKISSNFLPIQFGLYYKCILEWKSNFNSALVNDGIENTEVFLQEQARNLFQEQSQGLTTTDQAEKNNSQIATCTRCKSGTILVARPRQIIVLINSNLRAKKINQHVSDFLHKYTAY